MKMYTSLLAAFVVALTVFVTASGSAFAQSQRPSGLTQVVPPIQVLPPIGTEQKVTTYALSQITHVFLIMMVKDTNQNYIMYTNYVYYGAPASKSGLDQQIIAAWMTDGLKMFASDNDPSLNKNADVRLYASADRFTANTYFEYFGIPYTYTRLVKTDSSYTPPDLSWLSTGINSYMAFYIPDLHWARLEIGYAGEPSPFEIDDRRLDASSDPIASDGGLVLPTSIIMNSSPTGSFWLQMSLLTDDFKLVDGNGYQLKEPQTTLALYKSGITNVISAQGGPSGRGYIVQVSQDMRTWSNCCPVQFASPVEANVPLYYRFNSRAALNTFRTVSTNSVPY